MVIGIPRAFLYHRYHVHWETFFRELGQEVLLSPETDKEILHRGTMAAIDESCLSNKIFLGHVAWLQDKCDMIFVPRYANTGQREIFCTKFEALPDIVRNTFRKNGIEVLDTNIDVRGGKGEMGAYLGLGKALKKNRTVSLYAFMQARWVEHVARQAGLRAQQEKLAAPGMRILVVGHGYNVYDAYVGRPILHYLEELGVTPILADVVDRKRALNRSYELTETLPWLLNRELVGAVQEYRGQVDGMILVSAFPCGPDSLVNDVLLRRVRDLPTLQLILDGQEGTAGLETRLESFVDILQMRKGERSEPSPEDRPKGTAGAKPATAAGVGAGRGKGERSEPSPEDRPKGTAGTKPATAAGVGAGREKGERSEPSPEDRPKGTAGAKPATAAGVGAGRGKGEPQDVG